jgi:uncharacterized protein
MTDRPQLPGKFIWFEHLSQDAKKAQAFYGEVFGWKVDPFPMGDFTYEMVRAGDGTIGGYAETKPGQSPHWIAYVSTEDVDAAAAAATRHGGRVVEAPYDVPGVGRMARIADPQGAEIALYKSVDGDDPDAPASNRWCWNELHTTDATAGLAFYEKVLGYQHRAMPMGPGETYHIISRGGVDRGGASTHLSPGEKPHWLPYVAVDDADATVDRARKNGGTVAMGPHDIPGVGRIAVLGDPTGAIIAILKPAPMGS